MEWGFIWLMFVLKIPIIALLLLVWWAVKQTPDISDEDSGDGGIRVRSNPHTPPPPRRRPRGPHGDPAPLPSPPRVRTHAHGRALERDG